MKWYRIKCCCCYADYEFEKPESMNFAIAGGQFWHSDEGPICVNCYPQIQQTSVYINANEKLKQLRTSALKDAIRQIQDDHGFKPPGELRSVH